MGVFGRIYGKYWAQKRERGGERRGRGREEGH
jgi:hypothetical protein